MELLGVAYVPWIASGVIGYINFSDKSKGPLMVELPKGWEKPSWTYKRADLLFSQLAKYYREKGFAVSYGGRTVEELLSSIDAERPQVVVAGIRNTNRIKEALPQAHYTLLDTANSLFDVIASSLRERDAKNMPDEVISL